MVQNVTGAPVTGDNLFGRRGAISELWRRLTAGQNVLLLAPRRVGKTSLMHELGHAPRPGWVVFYSDLERCNSATDVVADMIAHLVADSRTRTYAEALLEAIPVLHIVTNIFKRIKSFVIIEQVRVDLRDAIAPDWETTAIELQARLAKLPADQHLLFIQDELPILLSKLLKTSSGKYAVERLLEWLRSLRQDPKLYGRVLFLAGGSISLAGVLRRHSISSPINDLSIFHVEPWPRPTAAKFIEALSSTYDFPISPQLIDEMLDLLGEFVPYHLQLFFQALLEMCDGDSAKLNSQLVNDAFSKRLAGPTGGPFLDHYSERLEHVLDGRDIATARSILGDVSSTRAGVEYDVLLEKYNSGGHFGEVLNVLHEDGYLEPCDKQIQFRSNLVREYWRRAQRGRNR